MPKIHLIEKNEAADKYWIVTYEDPDDHYNETTYEVPFKDAKTKGEAFWMAMWDIDALQDPDEMVACYEDEGFDNIDDLRNAVVAFIDDPKSALAQRCPKNIEDRTFVSAELVQKAARGKKR